MLIKEVVLTRRNGRTKIFWGCHHLHFCTGWMVLVNFQSFSVSSTTEGRRGAGHQFNTVPGLRIRGDYLHELCNFLLRGAATKDFQIHVLDVQVFSRCRRFIRGQNASALFRSLTGIQVPPGYGHRNEDIHF
jgi:hypothetical protein